MIIDLVNQKMKERFESLQKYTNCSSLPPQTRICIGDLSVTLAILQYLLLILKAKNGIEIIERGIREELVIDLEIWMKRFDLNTTSTD